MKIFWLSHFFVFLQSQTDIVLWCNGSTTDSGPVCLGSNPSKTTKIYFCSKSITCNTQKDVGLIIHWSDITFYNV